MAEKYFHLDSEYRGRFQEYHMAGGRVYDSRQVNWRQIEWEKVVGIVTNIRDKKYLTHSNHPDFKFFVVYRWAGINYDTGRPVKIREWAVGWSNGEKCFMTDIAFKTGEVVRQYVKPVSEIERHIHPRVGGQYHGVIAPVQ